MKLSYNVDENGGVFIGHKPQPKPRMTRSDKWKKRPIVQRYYGYCNIIKLIDNRLSGRLSKIVDTGRINVVFFLPIPKSRDEKEGDPHQVTPDIDNFLKALLDAICDNDSHVHEVTMKKQYTEGPPGTYINKLKAVGL